MKFLDLECYAGVKPVTVLMHTTLDISIYAPQLRVYVAKKSDTVH